MEGIQSQGKTARHLMTRASQCILAILLVMVLALGPGGYSLAFAQDPHQSSPRNYAVLAGLPETPIALTPSNGSFTEDTTPLFEWTECAGASSYTLELDRAANFSSEYLIRVDDIHETQFTSSEDLAQGQWFWHVRAVNASGPGQFSAIMEFSLVPSRTSPGSSLVAVLLSITVAAIVLTGIVVWYVRLRPRESAVAKDVRPHRLLTPTSGAVILAGVGAIAPYALMFRYLRDPLTSEVYMLLNVVAVPWSFLMDTDSISLELVSSSVAAFSLLMMSLHLAYVIAFFNYCKELTNKSNVLAFWFVSQVPVFLLTAPYYLTGAFPGSIFYSGPTFITLLGGYVLMRLAGPQFKDLWKDETATQDNQSVRVRE